MQKPNLRRQVALWLLLPLLALLALDAWLTYQRAMSAAHVAFDRSLEYSLKSIREGTRLVKGSVEVDLPYLALEMFESNGGGNIYYQIREEGGRVVTGYPDLPSGTKALAEPRLRLWLESGGRFELHGWAKRKGGWECRRQELVLADLVEAAKLAPRYSHELALIYEKEMQRGNRNRATLAVARKMVAWMVAVERRKQDFVLAEERGGTVVA